METETQKVQAKDVKKAIIQIRRELAEAERHLRALDTQETYAALERVQHAAFDAKDLLS